MPKIKSVFKSVFFATACAVAFNGCNKGVQPLDYLPEAPIYVNINNDKIRSSSGFKKLEETLKAMNPQAQDAFDDKISRIYVALEASPDSKGSPKGTGILIGGKSFSDDFVAELKKQGASVNKNGNFDVFTSGPMSFAKFTEQAVGIFSDQAGLDKMVATSQKKNAAAKNSKNFKRAQELANIHSIVVLADAKPIMSAAGPQLAGLAATNPQAGEALQKLETITILLDWDKNATLQINGDLPDAASAETLATTANTYLAMGKAMVMANPQLAPIANGLEAKAIDKSVSIKLTVPEEALDSMLSKTAPAVPMDR